MFSVRNELALYEKMCVCVCLVPNALPSLIPETLPCLRPNLSEGQLDTNRKQAEDQIFCSSPPPATFL